MLWKRQKKLKLMRKSKQLKHFRITNHEKLVSEVWKIDLIAIFAVVELNAKIRAFDAEQKTRDLVTNELKAKQEELEKLT